MTPKKRIIALGYFDGVHLGHAALIKCVLETGKKAGLVPSVITFDAHPQNYIENKNIPLINSPQDRAGLLRRAYGIDDLIFLHFDNSTVSMPWDIFIDHLVDEFGAQHLVAGSDFRFGYGKEGNSSLLERKCLELGIGCNIIAEVKRDDIVVSSTYIRELLSSGDMERANAFLGHPHVLTDIVRYGYKLGRTLGTPTINMCFPSGVLVPAFGVYATRVYLEDKRNNKLTDSYIGVTNIGVRPTVNDSKQITAETHILDFWQNLYGRQVRVEFHKRLRPEIEFDSIDKLKTQIQLDCTEAAQYFKPHGTIMPVSN